MKKMTLFINVNYLDGTPRVEKEEFDSFVVAKYTAQEAFKDGNVTEVYIMNNSTKELLYFKDEREEINLRR